MRGDSAPRKNSAVLQSTAAPSPLPLSPEYRGEGNTRQAPFLWVRASFATAFLAEPVAIWFHETFGTPTAAQRLAWPALARGENLLLVHSHGHRQNARGVSAHHQPALGRSHRWPGMPLRRAHESLGHAMSARTYATTCCHRGQLSRSARAAPIIATDTASASACAPATRPHAHAIATSPDRHISC